MRCAYPPYIEVVTLNLFLILDVHAGMNPAQLWQRYCDGDTDAFDRLYADFRGPLFRYVKRQCGNCAEGEELFQDVWMRAIRARDSFHGQQFQAWLFRIAHNRLVDFHRAHGRWNESLDDQDGAFEPVDEHGREPDRWSLLRDCVERLFAMLRELPVAQRDAFLLKEEGGMSLAEIASATDTSRETVKSRLRYALNRLRGGLEDCDD